jgi:hypothetical protein
MGNARCALAEMSREMGCIEENIRAGTRKPAYFAIMLAWNTETSVPHVDG